MHVSHNTLSRDVKAYYIWRKICRLFVEINFKRKYVAEATVQDVLDHSNSGKKFPKEWTKWKAKA